VAEALDSTALVVTPRNSSGLILTPDTIHAAVVPLGARGEAAYPLANITLKTLKVGNFTPPPPKMSLYVSTVE
jgi:hypothetical protein